MEKSINKERTRNILIKLSRAFMLPVAILPMAGLLLGIGGAIGSNLDGATAQQVAVFFKSISGVVFANLPLMFGAAVAMSFTEKNKVSAVFIFIIAYLIFNSMQSAFIHYNADGSFKDIMWMHKDPNLKYMIGNNLGIRSLQTSIFGGVIIGATTSKIMNKWSDVELPPVLNFFSGIRFIPIIMMPYIILVSFMFLLLWPFVGSAIALAGMYAAKAPGGTDGLFYGMLGRSLMPFGLHHIVIALAWQTPLGGELTLQTIMQGAKLLGVENSKEILLLTKEFGALKINSIIGDHNIWNFINGLPLKTLPINSIGGSMPIYQWMATHANVYAGRFTQDYPIYLGACQGIGLAMIVAAKKEKRKQTITIIGSAMAVAFLTGITEPLEFSFLFIAPLFYYGIYVPLSGLAYMLMKLAGAHVGVGFARGFIDYIIYGVLPAGKGTKFYWAIPISVLFAIIGFFTFYWMIKKFDWKTPGRDDEEVKLIDKKLYKKLQEKKNSKDEDVFEEIVKAFGGIKNIDSILACASRIRTSVKDIKKVNSAKLKELGAMGVIQKGQSVQAIFGGKSSLLVAKITDKYHI